MNKFSISLLFLPIAWTAIGLVILVFEAAWHFLRIKLLPSDLFEYYYLISLLVFPVLMVGALSFSLLVLCRHNDRQEKKLALFSIFFNLVFLGIWVLFFFICPPFSHGGCNVSF